MSIEGVIRRQAGVISWRQALTEGMSSSSISRRVLSGSWVRIYPRVYLAADHGLTGEARLRAAALWAGPGAAVSGVAAAWWLGLWADPPSTMDLTVPRGRQLGAQRGLRVRRRDLPGEDLVELRGVWVTAVPLTVLDAAVALGQPGSRLLDRALQGRVDLRALYQAHCRNLGRRGSTAAADLLRAAADRTASEAERIMIRLFRGAQLTGVAVWVPDWRL